MSAGKSAFGLRLSVTICLGFIALLAMLVPTFNRVGGTGRNSSTQQNSQGVSSAVSTRAVKSSGRRSQGGNQAKESKLPEPATISLLMNAAHGAGNGDLSKSLSRSAQVSGQQGSVGPETVQMIGPVSQDKDLRTLPDIPQYEDEDEQRLMRHPPSPLQGPSVSDDPMPTVMTPSVAAAMPTPVSSFAGITSAQSACGCLPPDTDGDVGPNHYIQAVNSRFKIIDKTGTQLVAPTTYNSFFSALGASTPCGNNQNNGDPVVFYDQMANRWVISDFAYPAFPGTSFYQCIGVSKTADPVAGGWWLYALQVDPSNPSFLGDYPKFGVWPDAYYLTVNMFSNGTTFNGVRVYALPRSAMINGTGAPNPGAVAFTITPATLGDAYSLVPATFRNGIAPVTGGTTVTPEYIMAINSSATAGTVENQVFTWRFHVDFATPANSTFGVGANHTPDGTTTVNNFVDAFTATAGTAIVPQTGTTRLLDTLGDKLMYPLVYQNLGGVESIYATHTINNNQGGTGPTAIRWYQFNVTGSTIPAAPTQQQTFNNAADGLWRMMPSLSVDGAGNLAIAYTESSAATNPAIAYAGRLLADPPNNLAQGEAILIQGAGHQTSASGRWGDYSSTFIDPTDNCTFWHTNEYYSATSGAAWNTRIGSFRFTSCLAPTAASSTIRGQVLTPDGAPVAGVAVSLSGKQSARTITDSNGQYRFNVETGGFYTVAPENLNYAFSPSNLSFSLVADKTDAIFTASPNSVAISNPLDTDLYFVRQQYLDFLGREPDQGGLDYWSAELKGCGTDSQCLNSRRIEISAAFFVEQEFQRTGSFVYRLYKAGLGRQMSYAEFTTDRSRVVVGASLEQDKADFANGFVQRPEFAQKYGSATTAESFVDALIQNVRQSAGVDLSDGRDNLIAKYRAGSDMNQSRSLAVREAIESEAFTQAMYNPSFVLMQYFGYLRRDPDAGGYDFWLNVLNNAEPNNYHGMVCSFVTSAEYQKRFSAVVTHSNGECR